jgi:hypothetical protein
MPGLAAIPEGLLNNDIVDGCESANPQPPCRGADAEPATVCTKLSEMTCFSRVKTRAVFLGIVLLAYESVVGIFP